MMSNQIMTSFLGTWREFAVSQILFMDKPMETVANSYVVFLEIMIIAQNGVTAAKNITSTLTVSLYF